MLSFVGAVCGIGAVTTRVCRRSAAIGRHRHQQCSEFLNSSLSFASVAAFCQVHSLFVSEERCDDEVMRTVLWIRLYSECSVGGMEPVRCLSCLLWPLLLTGIWLQENICLLYRFRSAALYALWNARIKAGDDVAALKAARAATSVPSPFLVSFSQRLSVPVCSRSVDGAAILRVVVRVSPRYLSIDDFVARRILARCVSSVIRAIGDTLGRSRECCRNLQVCRGIRVAPREQRGIGGGALGQAPQHDAANSAARIPEPHRPRAVRRHCDGPLGVPGRGLAERTPGLPCSATFAFSFSPSPCDLSLVGILGSVRFKIVSILVFRGRGSNAR